VIEAVNNFYMLENEKCVAVSKTNKVLFLQKIRQKRRKPIPLFSVTFSVEKQTSRDRSFLFAYFIKSFSSASVDVSIRRRYGKTCIDRMNIFLHKIRIMDGSTTN
jgi:O-phosphoseryl-tRNA(Cys) synthetase